MKSHNNFKSFETVWTPAREINQLTNKSSSECLSFNLCRANIFPLVSSLVRTLYIMFIHHLQADSKHFMSQFSSADVHRLGQ